MAQDAVSGENREDEALDELLLLCLSGGGGELAEVFREQKRRVALGLELGPEGERSESPLRRHDEGTAIRLAGSSGGIRSGHVSGAGAGPLRDLALSLGGRGRPAGEWRPPAPAPVDAASEGLAARRLEELAAFLRHAAEAEPRLQRTRARIQRDERRVQVVSSEWGQATDRREWWRLELEVDLEAESGRRSSARRARGWSGPGPEAGFGSLVDELFACAVSGLEAEAVMPGAPPVVFAAGGGAVLFHEAVGHALEGDVAARAGTVLASKPGTRVGPEFLSVFDDPTLPGRAGSARCDDEGVAGRAVALLDAGCVGEPLLDGLRSDFDLDRATGHGRRASHRVPPLPRLSNTYLAPGPAAFEDLLSPVGCGVLVERLESGAFDPATGAFRLRVAEARRIEGGRPGRPLKPFRLEGDTLSLLSGIEDLGGELGWDDGCRTCGRDGQWLPVANGSPALRVAEGTLRVR
jgi:TldD protein